MTEDTREDNTDDTPWRSKKYMKMSDEEIVELSFKPLPDKDRYFVIQELEYRNLAEEAKKVKLAGTKKEMRSKPWWKYIPLLFALFFLIKQLAGR